MTSQTCAVCEEAITNPVCPDCIANEVVQWLNEKSPSSKFADTNVFSGYDSDFFSKTTCILCKKVMSICPHCCVSSVYDELRNKNKKLAGAFERTFNFQLF